MIQLYTYKHAFLFHCGLSQDSECYSLSTQQALVCPSYVYWFTAANSRLPVLPAPSLPRLGTHKSVLYICESVSVL